MFQQSASPCEPRTDEYLKLVQSTNDVVAPGPGPRRNTERVGSSGELNTESLRVNSM